MSLKFNDYFLDTDNLSWLDTFFKIKNNLHSLLLQKKKKCFL